MNLTIAIDDVNPKKGWRILGDKTEEYFFSLNKDFGAKFTLFIPSNHHNTGKLSENREWINELKSTGIFELAAHGHFHQTSDKNKWGEMEFAEIQDTEVALARVRMIEREWESVGIVPEGWRNPGWICSPQSHSILKKSFKYAAVHYQHNHSLDWEGCKAIFGADGIHESEISLHNGNIMFQSHIFGDWNDNTWNDVTFKQIQLSLDHLVNNYSIVFKTINEI